MVDILKILLVICLLKKGIKLLLEILELKAGRIDIISKKNDIIFINEVKKRSFFAENCVSVAQMERIWFVYGIFIERYVEYKNFEAIMQLILVVNNEATILEIL